MIVTDHAPTAVLAGTTKLLRRLGRGTLFWKYVALFIAVMGASLLLNSLVYVWFAAREHRDDLLRFQEEQARAAASKISQFVREIEGQLGWMTHLSWTYSTLEQREMDGSRLMRQVPAITELTLLDDRGWEQLFLSRYAMDRRLSNVDHSVTPSFRIATAFRTYYGPVSFRRETEPYMTLAVAGTRPDGGVAIAQVNLKHIWDVVSQIRVGERGRAYVVDSDGQLIAHPDISLVLRNLDLSHLPQVSAARDGEPNSTTVVRDIGGQPVLSTYAHADPLGWYVFIELPEDEANAPLYASIAREGLAALGGLMLALLGALVMARRIVIPIRSLTASAGRIGSGALDHRININTGDELQTLGEQFNRMASQLQRSYATLEHRVDERTQQLQAANQSKSRFVAAASHDLRQPLHALNLFVAQLRNETDPQERARLAERIDAAVDDMNGLFNGLLDISRLDAGVMQANVTEFSIATLLERLRSMFADMARAKGLQFRVVTSASWVRSDAILLERVLLNLIANAIRYTTSGRVLIGCRRKGGALRIDVCDTGIGIPPAQQVQVFDEFYRIGSSSSGHGEGLGLGLAIVARLCTLLGHPVALASVPGIGSRFSVTVPIAPAGANVVVPEDTDTVLRDPLQGRLVAVIDDDPLVLDGTAGLLRSWGCRVAYGSGAAAIRDDLAGAVPDLIISDFHLRNGETGVQAIATLRATFNARTPAFLISGDISSERLQEARSRGLRLLHKPLNPMALRTMMTRLLRPAAVS